ncbi:hypothetical protein CL628_02990 [bacterium]|nr:hypothetical protein [bacterium]
MKIAIDVRSLMEGRVTGVEVYTTEIIRALLTVGSEHEYHLFYNSYRSVTLPEFRGNVTVHPSSYPNKLFNVAQLVTRRPRWDKLLPVTPDCVFVPNVRLMPLSFDVPVVVTAHDLSFERFPEFFSWRRRLWHRTMLPQQLMFNADHVFADSAATAHDVTELYNVPTADVSVVYPGVGQVQADVSVSEVRRSHNLPEKYVLYLGSFEPRKNIPSIIAAFSTIAGEVEHDLVLAGSRGWLMEPIKRALAESPVRDRIHYLGFVPEAEKHALYASADLFVYPSFYEGFGFPPLESLLAGTPVITSMNSALPEVVGEWATLINPYDPSELAAVMRELLHDVPPVTADTQGRIANRFSWEAAANQILKKIAEVV